MADLESKKAQRELCRLAHDLKKTGLTWTQVGLKLIPPVSWSRARGLNGEHNVNVHFDEYNANPARVELRRRRDEIRKKNGLSENAWEELIALRILPNVYMDHAEIDGSRFSEDLKLITSAKVKENPCRNVKFLIPRGKKSSWPGGKYFKTMTLETLNEIRESRGMPALPPWERIYTEKELKNCVRILELNGYQVASRQN